MSERHGVVGYVPGAYDMFHVGHLNILRRAREDCDVLVVGAVTDEVVEVTKGKRPVVPLTERMEILSSIGIVDRVVAEKSPRLSPSPVMSKRNAARPVAASSSAIRLIAL